MSSSRIETVGTPIVGGAMRASPGAEPVSFIGNIMQFTELIVKTGHGLMATVRTAFKVYATLLTEERCRFCHAYIDRLGLLHRAGAAERVAEPVELTPASPDSSQNVSQNVSRRKFRSVLLPGDEPYSLPPSRLLVLPMLVGDAANACMPAPLHGAVPSIKPDFSNAICKSCFERIGLGEPLVSELPLKSGGSLLVVSGIDYCEPVKKLIRRFKYDNDLVLSRDLGVILMLAWLRLSEEISERQAWLVPIPLHWRRRMQRGYNQAALAGEELSRLAELPLLEDGLRRAKLTKPQNKLSKEQREDNLQQAFRGCTKRLKNKTIVLIDDVCTSGATLTECADEAYRCGAREVFALTVARAVLIHGTDSSIRGRSQFSAARVKSSP